MLDMVCNKIENEGSDGVYIDRVDVVERKYYIKHADAQGFVKIGTVVTLADGSHYGIGMSIPLNELLSLVDTVREG